MKLQGITVGVPREIMAQEKRVALLPEMVKKLITEGARVLVQHDAGIACNVSDDEYEAAGAKVLADVVALYQAADVVLKVKEPLFNEELQRHEVELMHSGQLLITFIHPAAPDNHEMVRLLQRQGVIALTLDGIPRISRAQSMDALTSMSSVAGYKSVVMAANLLQSFIPMIGTAVGVIPPARILIVGAGVAGLQAVATARRLGGEVTVCDIRPQALEQAASLGAKTLPTNLPLEAVQGEGGYARALPPELLQTERELLRPVVAAADIVILAALVPGSVAPVLVDEEMVMAMKRGSVIVDIAIDQGGNSAITEPGKVAQKHGVTLVGIKNLPAQMAEASTWMFSRNIGALLLYLADGGTFPLDMSDAIVASSLVTRDGKIYHAGALAAMAAAERRA